ncbi:gamma-glutamylcyclotransferase family protein [Meiothermus sp.]|uniref:gamma-glutamylcyclotransferase family protein n=1 Tax=Meiothermus sp. TaxID=1955249 RepID=UPI0021DE2FBD|nr:gamma-glutamylcyclotransferase family protein [Meiothermus sp.]GIW32793.1 MAG: gamma-glutamylcyclotransferase [Meiothermus sp.]
MNDQWYFAYGSNLSRRQMEQRTGPIREARQARLDGYRLAFNKRGSDGTGKANIVPDGGATVWGIVYLCRPDALREMDEHEGVAGGHYARYGIRIRLDDGDELDAVTYVAGKAFIDDSLTPSARYLATILDGARQHLLPDDYIRSIEALARPRSASDVQRTA